MRQVGSRGKQTLAARGEAKREKERAEQMADLKRDAAALREKNEKKNATKREMQAEADRINQRKELQRDAMKLARERQARDMVKASGRNMAKKKG